MRYKSEATSIQGFIQQLAVAYVGRGYYHYVTGKIPNGKDPKAIDLKLIERYGVAKGKSARARRKALGYANVQHLRFQNTFILLATEGKHEFFLHEGARVQDARKVPIRLFGYSISHRNGHPHVRMEQERYLALKAYLVEVAVRRQRDYLEKVVRSLWFEPYAPVRSQLHCIVRAVNRKRKQAQFDLMSTACIRTRRRIVRPFEVSTQHALEEPPTSFQSTVVGEATKG